MNRSDQRAANLLIVSPCVFGDAGLQTAVECGLCTLDWGEELLTCAAYHEFKTRFKTAALTLPAQLSVHSTRV